MYDSPNSGKGVPSPSIEKHGLSGHELFWLELDPGKSIWFEVLGADLRPEV